MTTAPIHVLGALSKHPLAHEFAREVYRVHHRYASEVVEAFQLCPFLKDPDSAFGAFCVMLDREPELDGACDAALNADASVTHLVYPVTKVGSTAFDALVAGLRVRLAEKLDAPPVFAVFHPNLDGDATTAHRLIGMLRRAPDPFVQLVPEGLHEGGTVFVDAIENIKKDRAVSTFARIRDGGVEKIGALIRDIHADREASYAPYLRAFDAAG